MTNGSVEWFLDQLIEHRIIIVDKTTYQVKYKHEILLEQAKEMEVMGKEMSYSDGYAEGYKRALEMVEWYIKNYIKTIEKDK
jgi:prephenate dehydratase